MAYFPLFVDLEGRQVLVVGGGKIAMRRVRTLLEFGCEITVVSPEVCEELREKVLWKKKRYDETDLESLGNVGEASRFVFVLAAAAPEVNEKIVCDCRKKKIPVNNASNRDQCDFYFPGIAKDGDTVVGITSAGGEDLCGGTANIENNSCLASAHSSHEHRKFDIIQVKRRNPKPTAAGTDLDIGFCGTVKVRAASEGEGVFFCEFAEISALILVIGRVETLETAETMVSEHGDEFLRAGPAELILERMGENRETAGAEKCRENFLRGDKFPGSVIWAVRV